MKSMAPMERAASSATSENCQIQALDYQVTNPQKHVVFRVKILEVTKSSLELFFKSKRQWLWIKA